MTTQKNEAVMIPLAQIEPNSYNARKTFDGEALKELAQNIAKQGLIQPVTVRKIGDKYEVICGARRLKACRQLGHTEIAAIVREASDDEAYDLSISENLQREDVPPMEAAQACKRLIETKRYDVKSLSVQFGKSEKYVYQVLKLCDLVPGIAKLVKAGKLTAAAGIAVSKYDQKIQAEILKDRLGEDGRGEWCHISATALENKIRTCYTNDLAEYRFDKAACAKCPKNSTNYDLFAADGADGKCADKKCLAAKQTAYLVAEAEKIAKADPKMTFIRGYSYGNNAPTEAAEKLNKAGHEFKDINTYSLKSYPEAPRAADYKKPEALARAQAQYDKKVSELNKLREQGKIQTFAKIDSSGVDIYYKEVKPQEVKSNDTLIAEWTAKKARNSEVASEKTAVDIRNLLGKEPLPKSAFTADEEAMVYYFMMSHLRDGKALGLGENKWNTPDDKKLKAAKSLSEEQKTIVRRDFLHHHLTDGTHTVSSMRGGLMLAFARLHLPEQTAKITTAYKDEYDRKNARLDERIAELRKQMGIVEKPKPEKAAATKALPAKTPEVPWETEAPEDLNMIPSQVNGQETAHIVGVA